MCYPSSVQVQLSEQAVYSLFSQSYLRVFLTFLRLAVNMPGGKEPAEPANEEQLLAFDPDEDNNAGISGEKYLDTPSVMAAKDHVSDSNISMSHADVKLLSSAILTLSEKIDKFEELPSKGKGKGKGKRLSDDREHHHGFPAKKPAKDGSSSSSDPHALESEEDIQVLMDKVAGEDGDLEGEKPEEDETLADLEKEYESEDLTGKNIHSPQLAKLLNKMFRNRLPDKLLKDKLERQARPENCDTIKPTRVNPGIWRKLREPTQRRDLQLFKIQQALVKGIIPIARLTDLSMTEKKGLDQEGVQQIKQFGLDALSLLTHVNYELNMQRKQLMKPDIGRDYASLCSPHVPFTDWLFGDDLQKQLKDIGDVNKIGAKVQGHRGPPRPTTGYVNNNNSKGSFSHRNQSKNLKGQTYRPWRRKDSQKSNTNNKRSSQ